MNTEQLKEKIREVLLEMGYPDLRKTPLAISENDLYLLDKIVEDEEENEFPF